MSCRNTKLFRNRARAGGATYQILACVIAAGLGVWLGAAYLGVEMEHLAYTALDEADVLQRVPEDWRPTGPPQEVGEQEGQISPEERAAELKQELAQLKADLLPLTNQAPGAKPTVVVSAPPLDDESIAQQRDETLAYWTQLGEITAEVAGVHDAVQPTSDPRTTAKVIDIRRRAFSYGARAIESLPRDNVDQLAIDAGFRIAKWYGDGADLYEQAISVWEGDSAQQPASRTAGSLEKALAQHGMEFELVRETATRTTEALARRYELEFPSPQF